MVLQLAEFVIFMALPWPFMWLALREYQPQYQNMRLIHMIITAVVFFIAAYVLVFTGDQSVVIETDSTTPSIPSYDKLICIYKPWDSQVDCSRTYAQQYYLPDGVTTYFVLEPCTDGPCVNIMLMLSLFYSGIGVLFVVLSLSEVFIISTAAVRGREG